MNAKTILRLRASSGGLKDKLRSGGPYAGSNGTVRIGT